MFDVIKRNCARNGFLCASAIFVTSLLGGAAIAQSFWQYSGQAQSRTVKNNAYFPVNKCINMGGGLEAPIEGEWGYRFESQDFYTIKQRGFDSVRIPIKWSAHVTNDDRAIIDPDFLARVDQIVNWGLAAKLNLIINVHHYDELYENPDVHEKRLIAIWKQLAAHYRNAPPQLMFEIINEPKDNFSGNRVNLTQNAALAHIRQSNPTRTVILAGDKWGGIDGMDNLRLPNDPYVIGTVHYYGPFEFTHQGAEWMGKDAPPFGRKWREKGDLEQLNKDITRIYEWREKLGVPILMGEYGTDIAVPMAARAEWARDVTAGFRAAQIPTCYYNFAAGFGAYDKANNRWHAPIIEALGMR